MTRRARHLSLSRRDLARGTAGLLTGAVASRVFAASAPLFDPAPHSRAVQRELWSWTTPEQAAELKRDGILMTRATSPTLGRGYAMKHLDLLSADPLGRLLQSPAFEKGRYTWVNPWATCLGFGTEDYGSELLRIELRPDAWMARIYSRVARITAVDLSGREVPVGDVLDSPNRLAGFYFVNQHGSPFSTAETYSCDPSFSGETTYRELYVGNPAMVARWTLQTPAIAARLEQDISRLARFARQLEAAPPAALDQCRWMSTVRTRAWETNAPASVRAAYESALAFLSPAYRPESACVEALVEKLKSRLFTPKAD